MTTTLNPSDKNANLTLSNGNLSVAATATGNYWGVRSTTSKSTGKWHFEATVNVLDTGFMNVGVASGSLSLSQLAGLDVTGPYGANEGGNHFSYFNGSAVNNGAVTFDYRANDVIAIEFDIGGSTLWFQNFTHGSGWGSRSVAGLAGSPWFVYLQTGSSTNGSQWTANFGATGFSVTPQAGFSAWDTGGAATASLFRQGNLDGIGGGGPFFSNPLARVAESFLGWRKRSGLFVPGFA